MNIPYNASQRREESTPSSITQFFELESPDEPEPEDPWAEFNFNPRSKFDLERIYEFFQSDVQEAMKKGIEMHRRVIVTVGCLRVLHVTVG